MAFTSQSCNASMQKEIAALEIEEARLDGELKKLEAIGSESTDHKNFYIKCLHEYNDIKDATQAVLGVLATYEKVTVGELHKKYLPNLKEEK